MRQSKGVCPFLKKTSPATLRALSTEVAPRTHRSTGGGAMSNLQALGRRCPIMGKALAVQSVKNSKLGGLGGAAAIGAIRAFSGKVNSGKAKLHTTGVKEARAMEGIFVNDNGESYKWRPQLQFLTVSSFRPGQARPPTSAG